MSHEEDIHICGHCWVTGTPWVTFLKDLAKGSHLHFFVWLVLCALLPSLSICSERPVSFPPETSCPFFFIIIYTLFLFSFLWGSIVILLPYYVHSIVIQGLCCLCVIFPGTDCVTLGVQWLRDYKSLVATTSDDSPPVHLDLHPNF